LIVKYVEKWRYRHSGEPVGGIVGTIGELPASQDARLAVGLCIAVNPNESYSFPLSRQDIKKIFAEDMVAERAAWRSE